MTRRLVLVIALLLALSSAARAGIDYGRMSQPDVMELLQLVQGEDWERLVARGEPMAVKAEQAKDVNGVFFINQQLWLGYFNLGRTREAARANARSKRAYYELVKDDPAQAELATVQLANALVSEGQYDAAIKLVDASLAGSGAYRDLLLWQKALATAFTQGTAAGAQALAADAAVLAARKDPASQLSAGNEYLLAAEMLDAESLDRATSLKYGKAALALLSPLAKDGAIQVGMRGDGSLLGRACAVAGDYAAAIPLYQKYASGFLKMAQGGKGANQRQRYQLNAVLGYWEDRAGRADDAVKHYREAVDALERTWSRVKVQENKQSFMAQGQPLYVPRPVRVYERLMRLMLSEGPARPGKAQPSSGGTPVRGQAADALELAEAFKSRALVDLLGSKPPSKSGSQLVAQERQLFRELEKLQRAPNADPAMVADLVGRYEKVVEGLRAQDPEYADNVSPLRINAAGIQKLLDGDTVLVEYFVGLEGTLAWVVTNKSIDMVALPASLDQVQALVDGARRVLRKPGAEAKARPALDALSKAVLPKLPPSKRLIVVPHGPLHHIPFAVLTDTGRYVIDTRAVVHVPSASVLSWCARRNKRPADVAAAPGVAFALGNVKPSPAGWDPLPGTATEVQGLRKILPHLQVVEGKALVRSAVARQATGAKVLHFATHGSYDEMQPLDSCLVLSDAVLTVPEILAMRLDAWSVTLSACQTGLGRVETGDDVVGLTRAFLYAGTPAVVSTLWKIADEPTARLMSDYYKRLTKGERADALRAAQLEMRKDAATAHPYFWGAFVITGDWR